jgi:hypothetical protein
VGVSVASRFEVIDTEAGAGGKTSGTSSARSEVKTSPATGASTLARLQPDAEYWERLGAAPPAGETHRYALFAWVPRAAIEQARAERAAKGRKAGAALLLAPVAQGSGCAVAGLLDADLALRLRSSGFAVSPLSGEPAALPPLPTVPVVRAACSAAGKALQIDWSVSAPGLPVRAASLSRPAEELFALEADLAAALVAALGSPR